MSEATETMKVYLEAVSALDIDKMVGLFAPLALPSHSLNGAEVGEQAVLDE